MSDLVSGGVAMSGRSQNGGGLGPVPVPRQPGGDTGRVTPPTEIMVRRRAREARRREENERLQRQQTEGERRPQDSGVEENVRPGDAGAVSATDRSSQRGSRIRTDPAGQPAPIDRRSGERQSGGQGRATEPAGSRLSSSRHERISSMPAEPNTADAQPRTRRRGTTVSNDQPRPVEATRLAPRAVSGPPQGSMNGQTSQPRQTSRQPTNSQSRADQPGAGPQPRSTAQETPRSAASSFPHAFERWEQLSSHWEGLTSYWIHRLEQSKEDLDREPLNQQMARQVTDLSAAGANLFHAVVELQRLRASSERKFQRWFFETRAEQERARENQARLEQQLESEVQARNQSATSSARYDNEIKAAYASKALADVQVKEMRRELAISKDEARRAWEELGRREQEERDRTASLKAGHITIVGGVQVVPTALDRQTRTNMPSSRSSQAPPEPGYTAYDTGKSDTDTDPFTEAGRSAAEAPPLPSSTLYQQQQTSNSSAAALQAARAVAPPSSLPQPVRAPASTAAPSGGQYSNGNGVPNNPPGSFYQHAGTAIHPQDPPTSAPEADERSYVPSVSPTVSQDEYELDSNGEVRRDPTGNPIIARRGLGSEDSDEYNVRDQLERERMLGQSYGSGMSGVEYGSGPTATTTEPPVDYEGRGYGSWEAAPRHHHPTRLSDVMEEDERSRTSPSRASQSSRGIR